MLFYAMPCYAMLCHGAYTSNEKLLTPEGVRRNTSTVRDCDENTCKCVSHQRKRRENAHARAHAHAHTHTHTHTHKTHPKTHPHMHAGIRKLNQFLFLLQGSFWDKKKLDAN